MAKVVEEVVRDGRIVLVYDNQMERWKDSGKIIKPAPNTVITAEKSPDYHRARLEKKRERAMLGANRALEAIRNKKIDNGKWVDDGPAWDNPQELDYVEAIMEAQAASALLVGDPYATKAAEFVFKHTGIDEKQQPAEQPIPTPQGNTIVLLVAELARRKAEGDIIDAETVDNG